MFNPYLHAAHAACWVENKEQENERQRTDTEEIAGNEGSPYQGADCRDS
jgi:hypothetical protein